MTIDDAIAAADGVLNTEATYGMTLRDFFAAQVIAGFNREMVAYGWGQSVAEDAARYAYAMADAMLKAREA